MMAADFECLGNSEKASLNMQFAMEKYGNVMKIK